MLKAWFSTFVLAWNLLVEFPLPFEAEDEGSGDMLADNNRLIASFPLVGFALAFIFWLFVSLVSVFLGNTAKSIVSALAIALALELISGGRNLTSLGNMIGALFIRTPSRNILEALEDTRMSSESLCIFATLSLFILRVFSIGFMIANGFPSWLFAVLCGSFSVQSIFSVSRNLASGAPFVDGDSKGVLISWVLAIVLSILAGNRMYAVLISFLIVFVVFTAIKTHIEGKFGGVSAQFASSAGTAAELLLWILGLTTVARS